VPQPELPRWASKSKSATPFSDERMAAYIGPRWESSYRRKLSPFFAEPAFSVSWNWAAFLVGPLWFFYRKLYLAFLGFFVASESLSSYLLMGFDRTRMGSGTWLMSSEGRPVLIIVSGLTFAIHLAAGGTANWLLFRKARVASLVATIEQLPEDVAISRLKQRGGVNVLPIVLLVLLQVAAAFLAASASSR